MSGLADQIIRRARALTGAPFRPQGRDPRGGLDCIGLILCAFEIPAEKVRRNYRLRGPHVREIQSELTRFFRRIAPRRRRPGDVFLCAVSDDQMHLAIECGGSFIHADARLRRIVETPGAPRWEVAGIYRRRAAKVKSD